MRQNKDARAATEDGIALMTNRGRGDSLHDNKTHPHKTYGRRDMSDAIAETSASKTASDGATQQVDVAVVGAGFAGLYLLHRLRKAGFITVVLDEAGDVGGTWYWNRYPGARCDLPTTEHASSFDARPEGDWGSCEKD